MTDPGTRGDRILLVLLLALVALASAWSPIRNYDYWWHLKTGALILETGHVPRADPFSFTARGEPWVDHEWLFQVASYLGHRELGPAALVAIKALLVLGLALLMAHHARREGHLAAGTAILTSTALLGASFRFDVRPELVSLLALPLIVWLAIRARDPGPNRLLWFVPAVVVLWSNLHPGVILAPLVLAAGSAVTFLWERLELRAAGAERREPRGRFAPRLALTAAAAALCAAANPYGFRIYEVPVHLSRLLASLPSPNLEWARPRVADFPLFYGAAALTVIVLLAAGRRLDPIAAPALALSGLLAAAHLRNIGLFFVLLPFGLARPARAVSDRLAASAPARWLASLRPAARSSGEAPPLPGIRPRFILAVLVFLTAVPLLTVLPPQTAWGLGVAPDNEPSRAVDFLDREGLGRRLYNDVRFGGYLIWRRFPEHPVFIDGRNEVYPRLLREVFASLNDSRAWQAFLEGHGIDAALVRYSPALERVMIPGANGRPDRVLERAFSANHFPRQDWALVYWDDDAMIFARRTPANDGVIARLEYRAVQPEDWLYVLAGVLARRVDPGPIVKDLERKLREEPGSVRARFLLAKFQGVLETTKNDAIAPLPGR
ncbi:MAG TPA: hypothetical protein VGV60_15655 [Candidatus Polarisedimenticolia bacterium]|nr:hypothetical protein [Candidatus Polarisedimenticolia bacterium]